MFSFIHYKSGGHRSPDKLTIQLTQQNKTCTNFNARVIDFLIASKCNSTAPRGTLINL